MKNTCIFILLFLLIFTACQPTPEVEFVVNNNGKAATDLPGPMGRGACGRE